MADTKISALPAATTPLAGTEVLPIVQGGVTKKVAVDDLTVKNVRSNATSGILQVTGPGAGTTRVATVPDANWTAARTDAAQSFTGDQTLSTGNLVIGTSGKGIDFSATPGTGTSELLADYEEGTWTPAPNSGTFSSASGQYTKIGRMVTLTFFVVVGTGGGTTMTAPIASAITTANGIYTDAQIFGAGTTSPTAVIAGNGDIIYFRSVGSTVAYSDITFTANASISGTLTYFV